MRSGAGRLRAVPATCRWRPRCSSTPRSSSAGSGVTSEVVGKQMYTFADRGGRSLTLRPEGTAPVVRAVLEHNLHRGFAAGEACLCGLDVPPGAPPEGPLPAVLAGRHRGARYRLAGQRRRGDRGRQALSRSMRGSSHRAARELDRPSRGGLPGRAISRSSRDYLQARIDELADEDRERVGRIRCGRSTRRSVPRWR